MVTDALRDAFLAKAEESLAGALSELANQRYNNCANRCYYACFQAAIAALLDAGIRAPAPNGEWGHAFVPARFDGDLIGRRKLYPTDLRGVIGSIYLLRQAADYRATPVSRAQAERALRRTQRVVQAIPARGEQQ